jgi:uncharacterized membrane protein YhaH (DUF805 family)
MRGNVIGFDPDTNTGAISGYDGVRYDFVTQDWQAATRPRHGDLVDFQAQGGRAHDIRLIEPEYVPPGPGQFYFSPSGRISRSQYWLRFVLPYIAIVVVLELLLAVSEGGTNTAVNALLTVFSLVAFWPSIAILVKRMHDRNRSGWTILYLMVPGIALTITLIVGLGAAAFSVAQGEDLDFSGAVGAIGIAAIILGIVVFIIDIWFFVEFGCLRGTIGANRFGPDPVRDR